MGRGMDLSKIETLIAFVGRSNISELTVTEKDTTVRIIRDRAFGEGLPEPQHADRATKPQPVVGQPDGGFVVAAPIFGVLHIAPAPGDLPFVSLGDEVVEGQTLFIIEAMKVFNKITAPRAGKIVRLTHVTGAEVDVGDMLAEIA